MGILGSITRDRSIHRLLVDAEDDHSVRDDPVVPGVIPERDRPENVAAVSVADKRGVRPAFLFVKNEAIAVAGWIIRLMIPVLVVTLFFQEGTVLFFRNNERDLLPLHGIGGLLFFARCDLLRDLRMLHTNVV